MFKLPPGNTVIAELTASSRQRRINLSDLKAQVIAGQKCCIWCSTPLKGRQYKWCSEDCGNQAFAWANPQKSVGLHVLLARQDFKCAHCGFDYMPYVEDVIKGMNRTHSKTFDPATLKTKINERLMKMLKYKAPADHLPEVDHIIPIAKGGQSIGFDNHQAICYSCHKAKTKVDNSGPRKKKRAT